MAANKPKNEKDEFYNNNSKFVKTNAATLESNRAMISKSQEAPGLKSAALGSSDLQSRNQNYHSRSLLQETLVNNQALAADLSRVNPLGKHKSPPGLHGSASQISSSSSASSPLSKPTANGDASRVSASVTLTFRSGSLK